VGGVGCAACLEGMEIHLNVIELYGDYLHCGKNIGRFGWHSTHGEGRACLGVSGR